MLSVTAVRWNGLSIYNLIKWLLQGYGILFQSSHFKLPSFFQVHNSWQCHLLPVSLHSTEFLLIGWNKTLSTLVILKLNHSHILVPFSLLLIFSLHTLTTMCVYSYTCVSSFFSLHRIWKTGNIQCNCKYWTWNRIINVEYPF